MGQLLKMPSVNVYKASLPIGAAIKAMRERRSMNQTQLGLAVIQRSKTPMFVKSPKVAICHVELGLHTPSLGFLEAIASVFNVPVWQIMRNAEILANKSTTYQKADTGARPVPHLM